MTDIHAALAHLLGELVNGARTGGGAYMLNSGDAGLLASLEKLSAADASRSTNDGATIAAHALHLSFGLSLMNQWARQGGDPFANAKWDEAWKTRAVDEARWSAIRGSLRDEAARWMETLGKPPTHVLEDPRGMIGSVAHLAYHLGAIRQINKEARGPKEGTFS